MKPKKLSLKKRTQQDTPASNSRARKKEMANIMPKPLSTSSHQLSPDGQLPRLKQGQGHNYLGRMAAKLCNDVPIPLKDVMGELEKDVILLVLDKVEGNKRDAANVLGMKYTTLYQKLKRHRIGFKKISIIE